MGFCYKNSIKKSLLIQNLPNNLFRYSCVIERYFVLLCFSGNRLALPENPEELLDKFCHVTVLYVNRVKYSWQQVCVGSAIIYTIYKLL